MDPKDYLKQEIIKIYENHNSDDIGGYITGDGPIPCDILFVGEAPGKTEVETGKPFVGAAGKNFEKYLDSIGVKREDIRITNTCFFRPIKKKIGKNNRISISNRPPKSNEISLFSKVLDKEIDLVNPKIIITLGNVPLKRLTNFNSIGECHGKVYFIESLNRNVFPMYHPSSLIYNRNEDFHNLYKTDWINLKKALTKLS